MTRKKVKLAFITNDSARKATYKKRKRGLLKKMDELTTLCDVKACAILYSPYEARPVVWPGSSGARDVIGSFKRLPEMEKAKKMVSQEEFLQQRVAKAYEQLKRQQKENRESEMAQVMYQCLSGKSMQNMSLLDLSDLSWVIDQHLSEIKKRIEGLRKGNPSQPNNNKKNSKNIGNDNNNSNNSDDSNNHNDANNDSLSGLLQGHSAIGLKTTGEDFGEQMKGEEFDSLMQPWSSFMDMMGPSVVHDHHQQDQHSHHGMGMGGGGLGNGLSGASTSNGNGHGNNNNNIMNNNNSNTSMMMMMMMGQFGEYQEQGINPTLWSNSFFR